MEGFIFSILSAATLAICGFIAKQMKKLNSEFNELKVSQRNQIKTSIVQTYETAKDRGHITPLELETVNRLNDSYKSLGGNTYIQALINHMNNDMDIDGDPIPDHK